jgi:SAM-dependent methyltransferase
MDYDAELQRHTLLFHRACDIQRDDHVLDIGCGTGQTTRDAARKAAAGSALGVDISRPAIDRARELAVAEGLRNVEFEQGDAAIHKFPNGRFDVAVSRFGTMFFDDPIVAFANIAQGLRPAGRLVMMVWQQHERNAWSVAIERALDHDKPATARAPDPFSLADRTAVETILAAAGFEQVTFADDGEPVFYGSSVETALGWVRGFTSTREALSGMHAADVERALERLRGMLAKQLTDRGVWFDSRAWIVEARRASTRLY